MSDDDDVLVLNGKRYLKQERWARDKKIHVRTVARHRLEGNLPWLDWAGSVFIPEDEGDAYVAARVRRRNPPRRRRQSTPTAEITA